MKFRAAFVLFILLPILCPAQEKADYVPKPGEFPPVGVGVYQVGELVAIDHVNRRGAIRLRGDNDDGRYHSAPSHSFALLPYGTVRYHGSPAELRDIPIGTVLHGYFTLPREGDATIPRPPKGTEKWVPLHNQALTLEDDFSFYQRQGRAWKIVALDAEKGKLTASATGGAGQDGLTGEQTFDYDASTRVWKGRQFGEVKDLAPGQEVQINLTWSADWRYGIFHCADVWLDEESRAVAAETQRQLHLRHQRHRWLPGWVDHVEHEAGGKGIVTVTLFGGMDPSLYEAARAQAKPGGGASIAPAEWSLRTWWQDHDSKNGPVLDFLDLPNPPPGSSGLQLRVQIRELLNGYRPGRVIRLRPNGFPNVKLPPEERVKNLDDR
jgi:hypothetical protein